MADAMEQAHLLARALVWCNNERKIQSLADVLGYDKGELAEAINSLANVLTIAENRGNLVGNNRRASLKCAECGCQSLTLRAPIEPQEIHLECDNCGYITRLATYEGKATAESVHGEVKLLNK